MTATKPLPSHGTTTPSRGRPLLEHRPKYDRAVASDGMTLDSRRGPVDLAAVERVLCGHPTPLTYADSVHLNTLLTGSLDEAERVAYALGIEQDTVLRRAERAKQRRQAEMGTAA